MYKVLLNHTEIPEPEGLSGFTRIRDANPLYGGFVSGEFGYVNTSSGGLTFKDTVSRDIISGEITDVKGHVAIEILFCDKTIFKGRLDLSSVTVSDCDYYSAEVVSDELQDIIETKQDVVYAIQPNRKITIPKKEYLTGLEYELKENREFRSNTVTGIILNVPVPLRLKDSTNEMPDGVFYQSNGNNDASVNGVVSWQENAGVAYDFILLVTNGSSTILTRVIDSFTTTGSMQSRKVFVSENLKLNSGDKISLVLRSTGTSTNIEVIFNPETFIQISDKKEDGEIGNSDCYGITVHDALQELLSKASSRAIELQSEFFKNGLGANDFLTNGNNIRGILSPINLSFSWICEQMIRMYDLEGDLMDKYFIFEKAEDSTEVNAIPLPYFADNYIERVDIEKLYSSIKAGYPVWQSESKMKGAEYNSIRNYETGLNFGSRTLDLTINLITSGHLIEEQRRLQFDPEKSKDGSKYDESIFLMAIDGETVEGIENYSPTSGILATGGVYNLKYTPARVMLYNERKMKHCGQIGYVSGEGNSNASSGGISEDTGFNFGEEMPFLSNFDMEIDTDLFESLKHVEIQTRGKTRRVKIIRASMAVLANGNGLMTVNAERG